MSAEIRAARQAEEASRVRVEREVELAEAAETETLVAMADKERYLICRDGAIIVQHQPSLVVKVAPRTATLPHHAPPLPSPLLP